MSKRILCLGLLVLATAAIATETSAAPWSITVTWTKSVSPTLDSEAVLYDGAQQCSVTPPAATTCTFTAAVLGKSVVVRSKNKQGAFADTAPILVDVEPAAAAGIVVIVRAP